MLSCRPVIIATTSSLRAWSVGMPLTTLIDGLDAVVPRLLWAAVGDRRSGNTDGTPIGGVNARDALDKRALTRAVVADDGRQLPAIGPHLHAKHHVGIEVLLPGQEDVRDQDSQPGCGSGTRSRDGFTGCPVERPGKEER